MDAKRYTMVPRTLSFLVQADQILLLRLPTDHPDWPGRFNGVGGHIERGEDAAGAARREIREETGLEAEELTLRGTVMIDTGGVPGIALYVFSGRAAGTPVANPLAGEAVWVERVDLDDLPLVEDLPTLLPWVLDSGGGPPFSALYRFAAGTLQIQLNGHTSP